MDGTRSQAESFEQADLHSWQQGRLFDLQEFSEEAELPRNGHSSFEDPAFAGNKTSPVHRWVPWIAGFSASFVAGALDQYLCEQGTVLDPFSGVGTTLIEGMLRGHDVVGFEINPYAALACRIKTSAHCLSAQAIQTEALRLRDFYHEKVSGDYSPRSKPPAGFRTKTDFYSPKVLRKVLILLDFISELGDQVTRDLFRLAFASTMVRFSNYSYEPSLGTRKSAGKEDILDFPVLKTMLRKLSEMAEDVLWFQRSLPQNQQPRARIITRSFFEGATQLSPGSIDLIITSPPYLNNYHYNRNTRPQLYWLGFAGRPGDIQPLENSNFGKFWQTVRAGDPVNLDFALPGSDLGEKIEAIRSLHPEKGVYGGSGWANYAASYFNDCRRFALGAQYALRPGGTALVVIGNSILQGVEVATDVYFGKIAESVGLELVKVDIPRNTRVGNSIIQSDVRVSKAKAAHRLYEAVVELRQPG